MGSLSAWKGDKNYYTTGANTTENSGELKVK